MNGESTRSGLAEGEPIDVKVGNAGGARRLGLMLAMMFGLTIASFLTSRVLSEYESRGTREAARTIESTLPALESLSRVRTELSRTDAVLGGLSDGHQPPEDVARMEAELRASRERLRSEWGDYVAAPVFPGEAELIRSAEANLQAMDESVARAVRAEAGGDLAATKEEVSARARPAIARTDEAVKAASALNRRTALEAAQRITARHDSSRNLGIALDALSALLAAGAAYYVIRVVRRFWELLGARVLDLEHFAGRVAHDIRSPLGTVSIALDLAKRQPEVAVKTRSILDRGSRTLQRVGELVDGLLVFAVAGRPQLAERGTSVREVLDGIVDEARANAADKGIDLVYEPPSDSALITCTPGVLVSLTWNLLTNAMKYMGDTPTKVVSLRARTTSRTVQVEVADTGPGIAPELRARIFDPHVRGADATIPGLGLGLATVRRLAEAHGGTVRVEANPGGGSRFCFELPRWEPHAAPRRARRLDRTAPA